MFRLEEVKRVEFILNTLDKPLSLFTMWKDGLVRCQGDTNGTLVC